MCGICGIVASSPQALRRHELRIHELLDDLQRRGPDNTGVARLENTLFGHTRLKIVDLSDNANQPMMDSNSQCMVTFNGEIYNFQELRSDLKSLGIKFETSSDTEVILHAYLKYGLDSISLFDGIFSIAICDVRIGTTFLVRDRFGIKPLFYGFKGSNLFFSSHQISLRNTIQSPIEISEIALTQYLMFGFTRDPATIDRNLAVVGAGDVLIIPHDHPSDAKLESWKSRRSMESHFLLSDIKHRSSRITQAKSLIESSIKSQLPAEVPFGIFLSGGIDSSLLVSIASRESIPFKALNIAFEGSPNGLDESDNARQTSESLGLDFISERITAQDVHGSIEAIADAMQAPSFDGVNTFFASRLAARNGLKVVISGLGVDELFGGYGGFRLAPYYRGLMRLRAFFPVISSLAERAKGISYRLEKLGRLSSVTSESGLYTALRANGWIDELNFLGYSGNNIVQDVISDLEPELLDRPLSSFQTYRHFEVESFLKGRLLRDADSLSMYHSIEMRVPFLSNGLAEYSNLLANSKWEKELVGKKIIKSAAFGNLPSHILKAPKRGFSMPIAHWINDVFEEYISFVFMSDDSPLSQILSRRSYSSRRNFRRNLGAEQQWKYLMLAIWAQRHDVAIASCDL